MWKLIIITFLIGGGEINTMSPDISFHDQETCLKAGKRIQSDMEAQAEKRTMREFAIFYSCI